MLAPPGAGVICYFQTVGQEKQGPAEGARVEERVSKLTGRSNAESGSPGETSREAAGQPLRSAQA